MDEQCPECGSENVAQADCDCVRADMDLLDCEDCERSGVSEDVMECLDCLHEWEVF